MHQLTVTGRSFAERLREAVDEGTTSRRTRPARRRSARVAGSGSSPVANPRRVRYSDELFVERVRKALD